MATACIAQSTLRVHGNCRPIIARFDQPHASSDGGALLLKLADDRLGLTWRLASTIRDQRQPGKVAHPLRDLLRQRVFGLACGYADCNDAARLGDDPIHKLLLDRDPLDGAALGSQPTLSRFETTSGWATASGSSRSISMRPTIRPTGNRSWPSSTATTTRGAICP
jgi:hypothetical protein